MMKNLTATTTCIFMLTVLISCADSGKRQASDTTDPNELQISTADSGQSFDNLTIISETTGILSTNCYLLYDSNNKKAALFDPGDLIPVLVSHITENDLDLQYIFFTHCHPDHMYGMISMNLRDQYPEARICFSKEEYEDMYDVVARWDQSYPEYLVEGMLNDPNYVRLFDMDYSIIGEPDVYIEDGQVFQLGDFSIKAITTPGHARGSVSFHIENVLFSGDELQYRTVGGTQTSPVSSFTAQVQSVRNLYNTLPDETVVYPGHGRPTTIGDEKIINSNITLEKAIQK